MKYEEKNRGHLTLTQVESDKVISWTTTTTTTHPSSQTFRALPGNLGTKTPLLFKHISSSWVKIRLHTENQPPRLSGSALKVSVVGWGGVVVVVVVVQLITLSIPT